MVVRIVTFGAASVEAARTWARESVHTFRSMPGPSPTSGTSRASSRPGRTAATWSERGAYCVMDVIE